MGDPRTIKLGDNDTYYYAPLWSPDGKLIAYSNSRGEIWYVNVTTGKTTKVDTDPTGPRGSGTRNGTTGRQDCLILFASVCWKLWPQWPGLPPFASCRTT